MEDSIGNTIYICPFLLQCTFMETHQEKTPELAQWFYKQHCTSESTKCALRMVYETLGSDAGKVLMLPDQIDWADQIIAEYESSSSGG